jgi:hypothetical protein
MFNFFSNLYKRWFKKDEAAAPDQPPMVEDLAQRLQRATESILENENLTADLDDDAAKAVLDWGLACAQKVVQETAGFEALAAEPALSDRLQATHRLIRAVSRWVLGQQDMDAASASAALSVVMEQAAVIYGQKFTLPVQAQYTAFLAEQAAPDEPAQMISKLRELVESNLRKK